MAGCLGVTVDLLPAGSSVTSAGSVELQGHSCVCLVLGDVVLSPQSPETRL